MPPVSPHVLSYCMEISVDSEAVFKCDGERSGDATADCAPWWERDRDVWEVEEQGAEIVSLFQSHHSAVKSNYALSKTVSERSWNAGIIVSKWASKSRVEVRWAFTSPHLGLCGTGPWAIAIKVTDKSTQAVITISAVCFFPPTSFLLSFMSHSSSSPATSLDETLFSSDVSHRRTFFDDPFKACWNYY